MTSKGRTRTALSSRPIRQRRCPHIAPRKFQIDGPTASADSQLKAHDAEGEALSELGRSVRGLTVKPVHRSSSNLGRPTRVVKERFTRPKAAQQERLSALKTLTRRRAKGAGYTTVVSSNYFTMLCMAICQLR